MLGQMNREKPLDAITRETIQELRCAICINFILLATVNKQYLKILNNKNS